MELVSLIGFSIAAAIPVVSLFRDPGAFLEFPIIAGAVWLLYILPQAIGIYYNPQFLPLAVYRDGYANAMFMCMLCILSTYLGWHLSGAPRKARNQRIPAVNTLSPIRIYQVGLFFGVGAFVSYWQLASLSGGIIEFFSVDGSGELEWVGLPVRYAFFAGSLTFPALLLMTLGYLLRRRPPGYLLIPILVLAAWPVASIVFAARRSQTVLLVVTVAISLHLARGWVPTRRTLLLGFIAMVAVVFVFPEYRDYAAIGAKGDASQIDVAEKISDVFLGEEQKEFDNTVALVATGSRTGIHTFGQYYLNWWVKTIVPRQLVGQSIKNQLYVSTGPLAYNDLCESVYGWRPREYQSYSGAAGLFVDFWFVGALVFGVLAFLYGRLYPGRGNTGSLSRRLLYGAFLLPIPHVVSTGFAKFPRNIAAIAFLIAILIVLAGRRYVRVRRRIQLGQT